MAYNYFGSPTYANKNPLLKWLEEERNRREAENRLAAVTITDKLYKTSTQKKWEEMTTPLAATLADVGFHTGQGLAKGVEGIIDTGATVGAWGAKAIGADQAERKIRDFIAKDQFGEDYSNHFVSHGSLLGSGLGGRLVRGAASGVGQMLPSVAAAIITGGGSLAATGASQAASLAVLGTSAFGGGVEEALGEGASLGKATLYGAGTAGVELLTEKMVGGAGKAIFGAGMLDDVIRPLAKTGAGRVAAGMIGEGVEEGLSEIASPALKSIYKGVDAFGEYGEKDYWSGVGEAALIGAGTSAAFGGTVGHVMGTSGKAADVASLVEDIQEQQNKRTSLFREGEMSEGDTNDRKTSAVILDDVERIEKILKKSSAEERASLIKRYDLSGIVEKDGSVRQDLRRSLIFDSEDGQTLTENQNAPQSEKTGLQSAKKYTSPGLWRNSQKVDADLAEISRGFSYKTGAEQRVQLHTDELSEGAQESYNVFRRAAAKLSEQSGSRMQFAIVDAPEAMKGVRRGDTVYLNASTLEDGKWAKTLLEEATHFTQGTKEAAAFYDFLVKDDALLEQVADELTEEGNGYGFTEENIEGEKAQEFMEEVYGHASAEMLTNAEYIDKLTRADRTLAEKIKNRISDVADSLRGYVGGGSFEVRKQLRRANKAVSLFEDALEKAEPLTRTNEEKMHVSGGDYSFLGVAEDGKKIYESNFPKGTPKSAKSERILDYIQNVWSKKPISLVISNGETTRTIQAKFDPTIDESQNLPTDASKIAGGNRHGTSSEQRVTLDLADDYYQIASDAKYNYSKKETGKDLETHNDVKVWHYFVNDIYFAEYGESETRPYTVTINVKEKDDGNFVYSFNAEKEPSTRRTLHAAVNTYKGANGELFLDNSISQNSEKSTPEMNFSLETSADSSANQQTGDEKKKRTTVEDVARELEKHANVKRGHRNELLQQLSSLYNDMETAQITAEEMDERVREIADFIISNRAEAKIGRDSYMQEVLDTIKQSKVTLTEAQKAEVRATNDNFNAWRSQMMGGVNIVNKGTPLDVLWDEWAEKYPNIFQDVSETDMPGELLRIYKEAKESTDMGDVHRAELYDADAERIAAELPAMIADAFWKVDKKITPEYRAMLKAIAEKEEVRQFWKEKYSDTVNRNKALYDMAAAVEKIVNMKRGKYVNASNVKNAAFDTAIKELAAMNWRGKVISPEKVRQHFSELAAWYTPKNALYGVDGKPNEQYKTEIATALAELSAGGKEGLTVDEIRTAVEVIKYFAHEIEAYGTIYKDGKRIDAMPIAKEYITRAEKAAEIARRSGWITSIFRSKFARLAADPMFLMREADGFQEGGFFSEQFEQLRKGTIRAAVTERKLLESFENFWSGKEGRAYIKRYHDAEVDFYGKKMPLAEAISLYMTLKRDHTVAGAAYAGFEIEVKEETINVSDGFPKIVEACRADVLKELQPEQQLTLDEQDLALVEQETLRRAADEVMKYLDQSFSERDRELIRITEEIMEKCRDYKVNVDMALQGETNVTGGYYYPAKRAGLAENVDSMSMFEGDRVSNLSINKETVKNAHKLLIEPVHVVLMRHVKAISLYDGIGIFTDNLNRLYNLNTTENRNNPTTIRTTIARSTQYAKKMAEYFKEIKQDVEGISKKRSAERFYNDAIGYIRSVYAPYQLGTNPKTWVVQFSSMIASMNILDADSVVKGLAVSGKDVDEYCDLAWLRNNDGAAVLAQSVSERKNALQRNASGVMQKIKDIETLPIGKVDRIVVEELFGACQVQVEKDGGAKIGTEENKKAAGELLERVILETQQNSIATERTAAMRSGDELLKGFNMFLADSMKLGARFIEPFAEMEALRAQVRIAKESGNTAEIKQLEAKIEKTRKKSVRSTSVLVGVSVYNALIAYAFKWLFRRDDEENVLTFIGDVFGNMIGGVPFVRDIYTFFKDGFETENFAISTFNNLLQVTQNTTTLLIDAAQGKDIDKQTVNKAIRDVLYTSGQLSGVSVRNLYNNVTGIINRVSPEAGYWIDSNMYAKSYSKDLEKALLDGDDKMVSTITSIMLNQDGGDLGAGTRKATSALISAGYSGILPRSTPDVLVGADDIEIELNKKQRKQFEKIYSASYEAAEDLTKNAYFKRASKDVQAKALKFVYDTYYQLAKDTVLGQDSSKKNVLFAEAIPVETLAIIVAMASELKADTDKKGNAIAKSRMHKIEALIESLNLSKAQKYMMMGYLGYKNQNGKEAVERYIRTLPLSNAEKQELLEMSGY